MASSFTDSLLLEKIGTGDDENTWGVTEGVTRDNIDKAIAQRNAKSVAGGVDVTLTDAEMIYAIHEYTGTITANINVIVPARAKIYYVYNNTSGAFTLTVKTSGGTGIAVPQGERMILYCDGTNVEKGISEFTTTLAAIGALTPTDGNIIVGDGTTFVAESGATARTSLGLGSIATQAASAVAITGGSIAGITDLAVADGGTGASTASAARTALGLAIGSDVQGWDPALDDIAGVAFTKGILLAANGTDFIGLGVGADDTVLTADATEPTGMKWAAAAAGGATLAANTFTGIQTIPAGSVSLPSLALNDTNTGIYSPATNAVAITANGVQTARFNTEASGVNYYQFNGGATTAGPTLEPEGSDTNIDANFNSKGTGDFNFSTGAGATLQVRMAHQATAVNNIALVGAVTGTGPAVFAEGSDTNINLRLLPKGSGLVQFGTATAISGETLSRYIEIVDAGGTTRKLAVVS